MLFVLILLIVLLCLYPLLLRGRTDHPGLEALGKWQYAHRGLHGDGIPENSMAAFQAALEAGYGVELDVHLLKDGGLGIMHDWNLERTTGAQGTMEDLTTQELQNYHLGGTQETIPSFQQVLDLFQGKAPLIVELKPTMRNYAQLAQTVCDVLDHYDGPYCLESFDPRCVRWLRKNRPELIRGQLSEDFLRKKNNPLPWILKFILTYFLENFWIRPDFIACEFANRNTWNSRFIRKCWHVQGVTWTLKSQEEYDQAVQEGFIPIFEGFRPVPPEKDANS